MNDSKPFIIERIYNAPATKVWEALTELKEMKQWYFDIAEFKPEVGFEFQFWGETENRKYLHLCRVTEVLTGKKISYSWRYEGLEGNSQVTFELFEEGSKTKLRLTHEGLNSFPANNPDFIYQNFVEGWTFITGKALKEFVEKNAVSS